MKAIFEQLKKIVLPELKHYKDDLLVHDKNILNNYSGLFLYGYRETGTDLIKLLPTFEQHKERFKDNYITDEIVIKAIKGDIIWITHNNRNSNFLYFNGEKLVKITADKANEIFNSYVRNVVSNYEMKQQPILF